MLNDLPPDAPLPESGDPTLKPKPEPEGIQLDRYGDPVAQGTRMGERESYERVIEGLKMAADACVHLKGREPERMDQWEGWRARLDLVRRAATKMAGLEEVMRAQETAKRLRRDAMGFMDARKQLRNGLKQAAGGARQLAVCFRMDYAWSRVAIELETMERNIATPKLMRNLAKHSLVLPPGYSRH